MQFFQNSHSKALKEINFLTESESWEIGQKILQLKSQWISRMEGIVPAFTLGAASYIDATNKADDQYHKLAKIHNPFLSSHFSDLYECLKIVLEREIGIQTEYEKDLALPGFHIFLSHKAFEFPVASSHYDLQFKKINWSYKEIDFDHPISYTVPIMLPSQGGGLNYWDFQYQETKILDKEKFEKLQASSKCHFFPYHVGKLILHNGLIWHQIAPGKNLGPNDARITLQGHGLICDGILRLYW